MTAREQQLEARVAELEAELANRRMCVNCGKYGSADTRQGDLLPECVGTDGLAACTFDATREEAWQHWRDKVYKYRARVAELEAALDRIAQRGYEVVREEHRIARAALEGK